jgi:hypothetical protein
MPARQLSAKTGQGVSAWLDELLSGRLTVAGRVLDIDYEQYARAEASLAWLNLGATLQLDVALSPAMVVGPLLDRLSERLAAAEIPIVHLKAVDESAEGFVKAAMCASGQEPAVEGTLDASPALRHELLLNLRASGYPDRVREIVESELNRLGGQLSGLQVSCFSPAAPRPEQRIARVVGESA